MNDITLIEGQFYWLTTIRRRVPQSNNEFLIPGVPGVGEHGDQCAAYHSKTSSTKIIRLKLSKFQK